VILMLLCPSIVCSTLGDTPCSSIHTLRAQALATLAEATWAANSAPDVESALRHLTAATRKVLGDKEAHLRPKEPTHHKCRQEESALTGQGGRDAHPTMASAGREAGGARGACPGWEHAARPAPATCPRSAQPGPRRCCGRAWQHKPMSCGAARRSKPISRGAGWRGTLQGVRAWHGLAGTGGVRVARRSGPLWC
jgi:hypothetical protein